MSKVVPWDGVGRCEACQSRLIPTDYFAGECADCEQPIREEEHQAVTLPWDQLSRKNKHDLVYVDILNDDRTDYWEWRESTEGKAHVALWKSYQSRIADEQS